MDTTRKPQSRQVAEIMHEQTNLELSLKLREFSAMKAEIDRLRSFRYNLEVEVLENPNSPEMQTEEDVLQFGNMASPDPPATSEADLSHREKKREADMPAATFGLPAAERPM